MSIQVVTSDEGRKDQRLLIDIQDKHLTVAVFVQEDLDRTDNRLMRPPVRFEDHYDELRSPVTTNSRTGVIDRGQFMNPLRYTFDDVDWDEDLLPTVNEYRERAIPTEDGSDPYAKPVFRCAGRTSFFLDGLRGEDELVPYSIIDIMLDSNLTPMAWVNRFIETKNTKNGYAARWRAQKQSRMAVSIYMPFVRDRILDHHVHIVAPGYPTIINKTPDSIVRNEDLPAYGAQLWAEHFWTAVQDEETVTVSPGQLIEIPFSLEWANGEDCNEGDLKLRLEADAGYLPKARTIVDDGKGSFKFRAMDLEFSDVATIKLSTDHFSGVGRIKVQVV
ncbi:MAG: hypothetical protein JJ979_17310 [Roseibium sp.]|nr:hypothetical protein [Roseibium sp.]